MQPVEKKQPRSLRHGRLWLLLGVILLLAGGVAACILLTRQEDEPLPVRTMEGGQLYACDAADVMGLRITLRSGDSWEMTRMEDGSFAVDGEAGYQIESQTLNSLLSGCQVDDTVQVTIYRSGKQGTLTLTVEEAKK